MSDANGEIHVVHLIGSTGLYGAEGWILALMRAMDTRRFKSTLVNLVDSEGEQSAIVQMARTRGLDAMDFVTGGKYNLFSALSLAKWARRERVALLHGHGYKSDLLGLLAAKAAGCRIMTTPHGWSLDSDRMLELYEKLDRFSFKFMDKVCPLSPELLEGLKGYFPDEKLQLILNGVDINAIEEAEPILEDKDKNYTIGYVGQLIERKDLSALLAALVTVSQSRSSVRLVIIGDGPKRRELEAETHRLGLSALVSFTGFRSDAIRWLKTFDLFVLPSHLEGIPRCIMESMAARIPVVVSDIPGNKDLVTDLDTGLLFRVGDSEHLASQILYMMDHQAEAQKMAVRAYTRVTERHSNLKMAREYEAVYETLLS